jgi:hypothetical protein
LQTTGAEQPTLVSRAGLTDARCSPPDGSVHCRLANPAAAPAMPDHHLERELDDRFAPLLEELLARAAVTDALVDKDRYRILVCTLWMNVVLRPEDAGLTEAQLEPLHAVLNGRIEQVLGPAASLTECFRYLNGRAGSRAMQDARLTPEHRDMLLYFASMILDPDGHRRWLDEVRRRPSR